MKRLGSWVLLGILVMAVAACDGSPSDRSGPGREDAPPTTTSSGEASLLLQDLNDRLSPSHRCDDDAPYLAASYAERVRNRDTAACRFGNGSPLVVYAVRDGRKTYERHFAYQRGPSYHLYGPSWVVIAYLLTPPEALEVLREDLGARG